MNTLRQKQFHLFITGKVHHVGFRSSAYAQAVVSGVTGWVMNRRDGGVECVIQGVEDSCQRFIDWACTGSPHSNVSSCRIQPEDITERFSDFHVRRTPFFDIPR